MQDRPISASISRRFCWSASCSTPPWVVVGPSDSGTGYGSTHWGGRIRGGKSEGLLLVHSAAAEIIPQSGVPAEVAWLGGGGHLGKGNGKTKQFGWLQDLCNQKLFCPNRFRRPCNHPN